MGLLLKRQAEGFEGFSWIWGSGFRALTGDQDRDTISCTTEAKPLSKSYERLVAITFIKP